MHGSVARMINPVSTAACFRAQVQVRQSRCFGLNVSCNCGVAVREDDVILIADMCNSSQGLVYVTYNPDLPDDAVISISKTGSRFKVCSAV